MKSEGAFAMATTDDDVLKKLRELKAFRPAVARGLKGKPKRRSDAEVAHAVHMLDVALSSPSFQAVLGVGTKSAAAVATASRGSNFCQIYDEVEGYIDDVVDALDWVPVPYAATIQKVVRLLQKFANRACR
jgi:hypothetical protein